MKIGDNVRVVPYTASWYAGLTKGKVAKITRNYVHVRSSWGRIFKVLPTDVRDA